MDTAPRFSAECFLQKTEKSLLWSAILLLEFHMLHCPYRELINRYDRFTRAERWFGLLLLITVLVYLLITVILFPKTLYRVRNFLRQFCSFEQCFLIFYFFWYIITVALRQHFMGQYHEPGYYFKDNDWWMYMTGLIAFVMFPLARIIGNEKMKRLIPVMLKIIIIPNILFHAWALWQYLHMNPVVFPSGTRLEIYEGVSMAIGANRNTTGAYSVTMLVLCLYLITTQKSWRKLPYFLGAVIYLMVMILSNCRTSWYSCLITFSTAGFLFAWYGFRNRKKALRLGVGLLLSLFCVLFLHWARSAVFQLQDAFFAQIVEHTTSAETAATATNHIASPYLLTVRNLDTSTIHPSSSVFLASQRTYETGLSQRVPLYRASIYMMTHSPYCFLFGVTPSDVGQTLYGICDVVILEPHAHNFFLQMGMSYGVLTMLLTVVFVISLIARSFRILFCRGDKLSKGAWMIPVVVLCMLSQDMMEAFLNSGGTMVTVAFYLFAGWILELDRNYTSDCAN